jgi:hypothetical protein
MELLPLGSDQHTVLHPHIQLKIKARTAALEPDDRADSHRSELARVFQAGSSSRL